MKKWVTNLTISRKTSAKGIRLHCFLSLILIHSFQPKYMILKKKFYHIHVVLILSLNFSVTKWNLLSCYFLEITNSDKQNLKWKTKKLFVNLLKLLRPYFCVSKEMQRTLKKERSFRVIMISCDEIAKFTSTVLIIKKGLFGSNFVSMYRASRLFMSGWNYFWGCEPQ